MSDQAAALPKISLWSTALFAVVSVLTFLTADSLDQLFAVFCGLLFFVGTILLGLGLWNGIQRSRQDSVTLAGLLSVSSAHVPSKVRNVLWAAVVVQTALAVLFAALRPFTQQAFGVLVPVLGLGMAALWGSRFAEFFPRDDP